MLLNDTEGALPMSANSERFDPIRAAFIDAIHTAFIDAALDQDWPRCDRLREQLGQIAPDRVHKPYTPECLGPARSGLPPSRLPDKERHRFRFSRLWNEDRCMYCQCERKLASRSGRGQP